MTLFTWFIAKDNFIDASAQLRAAEIVKLFGEPLKPRSPSMGRKTKNVRCR